MGTKAFSQFGGGNRNFGTSPQRLADHVTRGDLTDVVIVAKTKDGAPWIGSSLGEDQAAQMLEQYVPQEA